MESKKKILIGMKRKLFTLIFVFCSGNVLFPEETVHSLSPWKLCAELTWDAGIRLGAEYEFLPGVSLKSDIGTTLFSLEGAFALTYDFFALYRLTEKNQPFQAELLIGLPYNMWVPGADSAMFSFGGSMDFGYRFNENYTLYLRAGCGYPVFSSKGKWTYGDAKWPVWPDLALDLKYSL